MTPCSDWAERLLAHASNTLSTVEERLVAAHLKHCEGCRAELRGTQALFEQFGATLDAGDERMLAALDRELLPTLRRQRERTLRAHRTARVSLAAGLAAVALLGSWQRLPRHALGHSVELPGTVELASADGLTFDDDAVGTFSLEDDGALEGTEAEP
jgi:hypothetical protein